MPSSAADHQGSPPLYEQIRMLRADCLRIGQLLEGQIRRHAKECPLPEEEKENNLPSIGRSLIGQKIEEKRWIGPRKVEYTRLVPIIKELPIEEGIDHVKKPRGRPQLPKDQEFVKKNRIGLQDLKRSSRNKAVQTKASILNRRGIGHRESPSPTRPILVEEQNSRPRLYREGRSQSARAGLEPDRGRQRDRQPLKSHRLSAASTGRSHRPSPTVPQPFQLSQRPPIPCTFAERHLRQMLEEKEFEASEFERRQNSFRANPIPVTTYRPDQAHWIGQVRRKSHTRRAQSVPVKLLRPGQPVPLSTYLRPSPSLEELAALRRQRESLTQMAISRAPLGLEEHSIRWRVQHRLRHAQRCLTSPPRPSFHAQTVPDFSRLQEEFEQKLAAHRRYRPSTVPRPFRLTRRQYNGQVRGHSCDNWTDQDRRIWQKRTERRQQEVDKPKWR